jgi:hypothetical protein
VTISKTYRKIWVYHKIILSNTITNLILDRKNDSNNNNVNKTNLIMQSEETLETDSESSNISQSLFNSESSESSDKYIYM